jgi:predicted RNA-binding Zn-ribbon protein involved in translation (DUF1610 family)
MPYSEGYWQIQTCPCCGYLPDYDEVETEWDYLFVLQECPKCGQESIEVEWNTGCYYDDDDEEY